mmetsp:Transcript_10673/g.29626  ORF Transcript_10673/g.29626 Transcript_10673/m.29626 type:complete len:325 (-) Transcript_10673:1275-2249(-)
MLATSEKLAASCRRETLALPSSSPCATELSAASNVMALPVNTNSHEGGALASRASRKTFSTDDSSVLPIEELDEAPLTKAAGCNCGELGGTSWDADGSGYSDCGSEGWCSALTSPEPAPKKDASSISRSNRRDSRFVAWSASHSTAPSLTASSDASCLLVAWLTPVSCSGSSDPDRKVSQHGTAEGREAGSTGAAPAATPAVEFSLENGITDVTLHTGCPFVRAAPSNRARLAATKLDVPVEGDSSATSCFWAHCDPSDCATVPSPALVASEVACPFRQASVDQGASFSGSELDPDLALRLANTASSSEHTAVRGSGAAGILSR